MSQENEAQRRPLIAANWKMYKNNADTEAFLKEFVPNVKANTDVDIVVCPPFTSLSTAAPLLKNSHVSRALKNTSLI
jgi:triosephosphate isomerase